MQLDGSDNSSGEEAPTASSPTDEPSTEEEVSDTLSDDASSEVDLPEHFATDPVIGDGVITLPSLPEEIKMPADLPESVAGQLITETVGNIQANNRDGRNISTLAAGVLQGAMARNFDELGTIESRANSGVMATPIASPTTQASRV